MSYSHTHRRKLIRRLKKSFKDWYPRFRQEVGLIVAQRQGPCIGSLQDLADAGLLGGVREIKPRNV